MKKFYKLGINLETIDLIIIYFFPDFDFDFEINSYISF